MDLKIKNEAQLIDLYKVLANQGQWSSPNGERCLELENVSYTCNPFVRFNSFVGRNFNVKYQA